MTKLKFCIVSFLLSLYFSSSFAQANVSGFEVDLQEKTPQSPNSSSLGKYFDIPVNMATGIPNISIPLYTIKAGNIIVPITLSYHAGGIQVDDIASWVGLGWALNAGGTIVKRTNGLDDYYASSAIGGGAPNQIYIAPDYSNIPYNGGLTNMTDAVERMMNTSTYSGTDSIYHFFSWVSKGFLDGEADEFLYNIPSANGKFYYNQKTGLFQTSHIDGSVVTGDGDGWFITTKDGLVHEFGRPERTMNPSFIKGLSSQIYLNTACHLTNINDPASGKDVHFAYDNYYKSNVPMGIHEVHDWDFTLGPPTNFAVNNVDNSRSGDNYVLSAISFDKGIIYFIKDTTTRSDYGSNALKEILIYNTRNILIKKFKFDYFFASNRLFLKSLQEVEYDANGSTLTIPPYQFYYDTAIHLPARLSYAQDKWGYYNGKTTNTTSIPSHPLSATYPVMLAADRRVDSNYSKAGMLNGIILPTGGKTIFEFENNIIGIDSLVGGLRIRRVTHVDSVAQKNIITEYRYLTPSGYSSGEVSNSPIFNYDLFHFSGDVMGGFNYAYLLRTESTPINTLFPNQGSPVFYNRVEKQEKSLVGDLLSRHYFERVIEPGETYTNVMDVPHKKELEVDDIIEVMTEVYKKNSDNSYTLIQMDSLGYNTLAITQKAIWNAQGAWCFISEGFSEWPGGDPATLYPMSAYFPPTIHAYKVMPSIDVKTSQYTKTIENGIILTVPTFYEYDSTNGNLKVTKSVDSKGDTTIRMIKYACDYISTNLPIVNSEIQTLIDHNMNAAPIEIITLIKKKNSTSSTVQSAELYEYNSMKIKKVYRVYDQIPYSSFIVSYNDVNGFYKDSHYQLQQEITAWDDERRPCTVVANTKKTSYTWDEKYEQPTSIIANASYEDVAYTSFEGQSNGSWTVASSNRDSTYSITGRQSYQLSNGSASKSGITSSLTYIVSYWSRNGSGNSFSVTGSSSVKEGKTVNGWTYYEHEVVNTTSVTVSGSGYIDELRIYPKGSLMASYTFETLRGITSQCDANNRISYYIYDPFSRLILIRDQDNNILKKICYNYAGQPENCAINCTNTTANWQNTTTALRCQQGNCGNTGYQEQEQNDMNPCSSTFNQTRWVTAGYNPTACPLPTCVSLTSTNVFSYAGYTASYDDGAGHIFTFSVPTATGLQPLGTVPAGNYTLTISRTNGSPIYGTFKSGCFKQTITGTSAVFYNVAVSASSCNSITVDLSAN